ncbi:MAG: hypothetical protein P1V51_11440 [Deltaproteobacteria bacterium]|nr:hypothetical protein [Deltaproteobacteria bacterium]
MIWQSEAILYGLMITNVLVVGAALVWAWRSGHLRDLESAGDVLFEDPAPSSTLGGADHRGTKS